MSSTDAEPAGIDPVPALAGKIWDEAVAPLAEAMRTRGDGCFALDPDPAAASYYGPPTHRVMQPQDFAFPGDGTVEGLVDALAAHWTAEGRHELAAMAPRLRELAAELQKQPESENADVSPFIYTMY